MIYADFKDKKLSLLGMGTMRLPLKSDNYAEIDEKRAEEMFDYAFEHGVNYFDTAWGYHNGQSEIVTGKLLKKYPRDKVYIATKFPGYDLANMDKVEEIFCRQLEKTGMEYFDFYLFHNVCEKNIEQYLDEKYGIYEYLIEQKKNGRIRHLGFSVHSNNDTMKRFLEKYGKDMEFCQVQFNWIDYDFQDAKTKLEILKEYDIPMWVMEPLRGGKLAKLSPEHEKLLKQLRGDENIPAWSFRFLQTFPEIKMILSGMSDFEQVKDNIRTFEENKPLNENEMDTLFDIARNMLGNSTACTSCKYCLNKCPQEIDIPRMISLYNEHVFSNGGFIAPNVIETIKEENRPSACIGCKSCEEVCPQGINISKIMSDFAEKLK